MKFPVRSLTNVYQLSILVGFMFFALLMIWSTSAYSNSLDKSVDEKTISDLITECNAIEDNDPVAAITIGNDILSRIDKDNNGLEYGQALGCVGWANLVQNKLAEARLYALEIELIVMDLGEASEDSISLIRRAGVIFHRMGDRISASENYKLAMQQATELKIVSEQIPILVNLGVLNSELRTHEQAIENYYQALDLMQETNDFRYKPPVLFNLAVTLNGQKHFVEGLKFFLQVEAMIDDQWPPSRIALTYNGLAAAYSALDDLSLARDYAEQSLEILNDNNQTDASYYNIISLLAHIYVRQGEDELATLYANQASEFYLDTDNRADVLGSTNPLLSLAATYENLGLLSQAIKMHKESKEIEREIQGTFNQEVMAQMQVRLNDHQERDALILLKNERINNQIEREAAEYKRQVWLLMSIVGIAVFLIFLFWQHLTNKKLKKMAMTDSLTQLGNRRATKHWLATHKILDNSKPRFLWLIDLDDFKAVNDKYDHDVGDLALQKISAALADLDNHSRFVARWGGEEFVLITDDVEVKNKGFFSELLLKTIRQTVVQTSLCGFKLTASVGVSEVVNKDPSAWAAAMSQADKALYAAKGRGKNCVVFSGADVES